MMPPVGGGQIVMMPPVGGGLVTTEGEGAFRLFVFCPPPTGGVRGGHNNRLFGLTPKT